MASFAYAVSIAALAEMMDGGGEFLPPRDILSDLTEAQATTVPPGSPHSIAQIVSHMNFYLGKSLADASGEKWPKPTHLDDTFAVIEPSGWSFLNGEFLQRIEAAKRLAKDNGDTASPQRDDTNVGYDLAESALHNAYHLGQVVLLRRLMGLWPPASGEPYDF